MKFIHITEGMCVNHIGGIYEIEKLCKFFGMSEDEISNEMYYFTNGEFFNWNGFYAGGGSETETNLYVGDVLLFTGKEYYIT